MSAICYLKLFLLLGCLLFRPAKMQWDSSKHKQPILLEPTSTMAWVKVTGIDAKPMSYAAYNTMAVGVAKPSDGTPNRLFM